MATERMHSLDGLRGVAAVIVVFQHAMLSTPLGDGFRSPQFPAPISPPGSVSWWLFQTPLAFAFAGTQAVVIFFALSGFVLTGPALKAGFDWVAYASRRVVRLWVPAAVSIVLAVVLILFSNQISVDGASSWLSGSSTEQLSWKQVIASLDLVSGPTRLNNPLWSMHWELLFSVGLAAFLGLGLALIKLRFIPALLLLTIVGIYGGWSGNQALIFWPPFIGGLLLALEGLTTKQFRPLTEFGLALIGILLLGLFIFTRMFFGVSQYTDGGAWLAGFWVPGSVLLVRASLTLGVLRRFLETRPVAWVGRISFSLYLVHVPILIAVQHQFGHGAHIWPLMIAVPLCFAVAEVFYRLIEAPSIRLARWAGARSSALLLRHPST